MNDAGAGVGADAGERYLLRLFVTGATMRSIRAIANVRRLLDRDLPGRYDLAVTDIHHDPQAARDHQVVAAPTLVKLSPAPVRRIVGDLSDEAAVRRGLGLGAGPMPGGGDDGIARG